MVDKPSSSKLRTSTPAQHAIESTKGKERAPPAPTSDSTWTSDEDDPDEDDVLESADSILER